MNEAPNNEIRVEVTVTLPDGKTVELAVATMLTDEEARNLDLLFRSIDQAMLHAAHTTKREITKELIK